MATPPSQHAGDIENMSLPPTDAYAAPSAHAVVLLSERGGDAALLQQLLALSERPLFSLQVISPQQLSGAPLWQADLLLLDRQFAGRHYLETLREINARRAPASKTKLAVLLDEVQLADDLAALAAAVKLGADGFLLKSELSLKRLLQFIAGTIPGISPDISSAIASTADNRTADGATLACSPAAPTTRPMATFGAPISVSSGHEIETTAADTARNATRNTATDKPLDGSITHQLHVDMESRQVHLSLNPHSPLAKQKSPLTIAQWLAQLADDSAAHFNDLLQRASEFQALPDTLDCNIRSADGKLHTALLCNIQIEENGQGRVTAAHAQLQFDTPLEEGSDYSATHSGFDNLGDSAALPTVDKIWRDLAQSLPVMCLLLDSEGHIVRIINGDPSNQQSFPEARIGQTLNELLGNDAPKNSVESIERTLNTGKDQQQIINLSNSQGGRWLETHITRLRGDLGMSRQVVWTAFDITQTKQAHQELLKNYDALTEMLNGAPLLFCQKDTSGRYQRANNTFCNTFNIQPDAIVGRRDSEIFDASAAQKMAQGEDKVIGHGDDISYTQNESIDGKSHSIHWHKFAIREQSGDAVQSIVVFGLIGENTPIEPPQINTEIAAPEKTLAPSGAIGQDFKLLISSIVSYTEMALSQKNIRREQRIVEHLNQLIGVGERARDLIISASPEKQHGDTIQAVEIKPLVKDMVDMLKPTLPAALNFRTDIDRADGFATVSPARFQRLIMQLLVSARDSAKSAAASDGNQILLRLENRRYTDQPCTACQASIEGDYIALSVQTSSNGIKKEELLKLVESAELAKTESERSAAKNSNNIILMSHENDGHIIVEHQQDTISLQLLFKQVERGK